MVWVRSSIELPAQFADLQDTWKQQKQPSSSAESGLQHEGASPPLGENGWITTGLHVPKIFNRLVRSKEYMDEDNLCVFNGIIV